MTFRWSQSSPASACACRPGRRWRAVQSRSRLRLPSHCSPSAPAVRSAPAALPQAFCVWAWAAEAAYSPSSPAGPASASSPRAEASPAVSPSSAVACPQSAEPERAVAPAPDWSYAYSRSTAIAAAALQRTWRATSFQKPLRRFSPHRLKMPASPFRGGERNSQPELRATACTRFYFYAAVVQLQNSIRHGQPDAAAARFGGEIQIENLPDDLFRNPRTLIADSQQRRLVRFLKDNIQAAAFGHRLGAILHDVEHCLLQQIRIDLCDQRLRRQMADQRHIAG